MKLEDWVKKDMTRYIKDHEPEINKDTPVRKEDYGMLGKKDYERHIKRALKQGRFKEATKQFDELKEQFTAIPEDHQQERKHYYRILQKSYNQIYNWVEDRHKTHRLLDNLEGDATADVFDDSVQAKDLEKDATNPEMAPPTIEDQMFRKKKPQMPEFDESPDMPSMPDQDNPFAQTSKSESPDSQPQISMPDAPQGAQQQATDQQQKPATTQQNASKSQASTHEEPDQPAQSSTPEDTKTPRPATPDEEHGPSWKPPGLELPKNSKRNAAKNQDAPNKQTRKQPARTSKKDTKKPPKTHTPDVKDEQARPGWKPPSLEFPSHKQPRRTKRSIDQESVFSSAANELVTQARRALANDEPETAKTKLIEARFEAQRGHDNKALRAVEALERQLAASNTVDYKPPKDKELFSKLYLKGVHAMHAGDYQKAAQLFAKRMTQAPSDHAARIRYQECQEAINDQTA